MVKYFRYIILASMMFASCKRQTLCQVESYTNSAKIEFDIDWSESNIDEDDINNVSIYAYAEGDDAPYTRVSGSINSAYIYLPAGVYTLFIFNDFVGDLSGINFQDVNSFDLFRAEIVERSVVSNIYYQLLDDEAFAREVAQLATWKMEGFEVSEEMVVCTICEPEASSTIQITQLTVDPMVVTTQCRVILGVENLDNAAYVEATVRGLASGIYLSTNNRFSITDTTTLYCTELDSRTYSDEHDGEIEGVMNTFGKLSLEDQSYEVELTIILNSGEKLSYSRDVTDQLADQNGVEIVIDLTSEESMVSLPESNDSMFGVEGWGDNEQVMLQ